MINVQVVALDQRYVFGANGQQLQNYAVFILPNGTEARAAIDTDTAKQLLVMDAEGVNGANGAAYQQAPPPAPAPQESPSFPSSGWDLPEEEHKPRITGLQPAPLQPATDMETVEWMGLPDEVLAPAIKAAFSHLDMGERMTPVMIRSMEKEILEKFGAEEWEEVLGEGWQQMLPRMEPQARPPQRAPQQPPIGQVQWANGAPMISGQSRSRTVPKTDMGYPVLNDGTVDPGEVVGGTDMDEDGVGSL